MTHEEIRDALPDVVHGTINADRRIEVEDHLRACAECASELRVLQMVKDAPSFAPMIDAVKVSSRILPYGGIPAERPRPKGRRWQTLVAVAAVVIVAVTLISRGPQEVPGPATSGTRVAVAPSGVATSEGVKPPTDSQAMSGVRAAQGPRELQVAVGLDDLSDGSVAQLASDLGTLDGLPSVEPVNLGVADPNAGSGSDQ